MQLYSGSPVYVTARGQPHSRNCLFIQMVATCLFNDTSIWISVISIVFIINDEDDADDTFMTPDDTRWLLYTIINLTARVYTVFISDILLTIKQKCFIYVVLYKHFEFIRCAISKYHKNMTKIQSYPESLTVNGLILQLLC